MIATNPEPATAERGPSDAATIELQSVTKVYRPQVRALDGVSFQIAAGESACLLGPNGAGKTTIIRLLNGALSPTAGQVRLCGVASGGDAFIAAKRRVGVVPQGPGMYDDLTTREYLELARSLYGRGDVESWAERLGLSPYLDRFLAQLSGGYQRRVSLAAALLAEPEVLLLDEPTVGLDPLAARDVRHYLREAMEGRTVLLCTHNLAEAEELCQDVVIIRQGKVLLHENIDTLRGRFPVRVHLSARQGAAALAAALRDEGLRAEGENGGVWLTVADPQQAVPALLRRLLGQGLDVFDCHLAEASLEDLFVQIVEEG
ncbi:MAG: ABC transporter ATP-binding protein [Chloroflexota bacterium]